MDLGGDQRCIVIGAGVAGAACARTLAERGWHVEVMDTSAEPAQAASSVPVGILSCHVSPDDNPLSQLTRKGLELTLRYLQQHLKQGEDWSPVGVLERRWAEQPHAKKPWVHDEPDSPWQGFVSRAPLELLEQAGLPIEPSQDLWQPKGAWVKPQAFVRSLLSHPNITFSGQHEIDSLSYETETAEWVLRIKHHIHIPNMGSSYTFTTSSTPMVVIATGADTPEMLYNWFQADDRGMHPIAGQVTWGVQDPALPSALPPFAVNGHGSFVAHVPTASGKAWFTGATFERHQFMVQNQAQGHQDNLNRLSQLLPKAHAAVASTHPAHAPFQSWTGVRCATLNRLPKLGSLNLEKKPGLFLCAGLGSRGLTTGLLCAEVVANQMEGRSQTLTASMIQAMRGT